MGELNAGDLNGRFTIQRDTGSQQNSRGGIDPVWADLFTVWGQLIESDGRELRAAQQIVAETTSVVKVRYRNDVRKKMRIRFLLDKRTFTAAAGTDFITTTDRYFENGEVLRLTTTGTLPGNLSASIDYYTRDANGLTTKLTTAQSSPAIDITGSGSGVHSLWRSRVLEIVSAVDQTSRREYLMIGCKEIEPRR